MSAAGEEFRIARVTEADAAVVVAQRRAMFADMGHGDAPALDAMSAQFGPWVAARLRAGEYLGWFAVAPDGSIAAGAGLWLMDWPPHLIGGPDPRRGNLVNVYTAPEWRRRGLARRLVGTALGWARGNGIGCIILHASAEGRVLYESLGFAATNEMRLIL